MASHLGYAFSFLVSCCSRPTHYFLKREKEQALENNNKDSLQLFLQVRISGNVGYDSFWVLMQEQVFLLFLFLFLYARKRGFRIYSYAAWISQNLEFYFVFFRGHRFGRVQVFYEDSFRTTGILTNQKKKPFQIWGEESVHRGRCPQAEGAWTLSSTRDWPCREVHAGGMPPTEPWGWGSDDPGQFQ